MNQNVGTIGHIDTSTPDMERIPSRQEELIRQFQALSPEEKATVAREGLKKFGAEMSFRDRQRIHKRIKQAERQAKRLKKITRKPLDPTDV